MIDNILNEKRINKITLSAKKIFRENFGKFSDKFAVSPTGRWCAGVLDTFARAADKKNYDRIYRWSVLVSILLMLFATLLTDLLRKPLSAVDAPENSQQELLQLSRHTLQVINAVPRTSLAKRIVKVPKVKPVDFALKELDVPEPELGALEVGPELPIEGSSDAKGTPAGRARSRRPELLTLVPPVYPKDAEKNKIEGTVELRIMVSPDGKVEKVEVLTSSGLESMDKAAVKAAYKTRFRPGIKDGQKVPMWITYPIQFALNKKAD